MRRRAGSRWGGFSWFPGTIGCDFRKPCEHEEDDSIADLRVNKDIQAEQVRVVAPDGAQVGVKTLREALWLADQLGLDLVEVAPSATPPVTRLMDYGKFKYEQSVKEREARKRTTRSNIKELSFRVKIGNHDYEVKRNRARRFLENGDRVRIRVWLRGREASRPQLGHAILDRLTVDLDEVSKIEQEPKIEGRNMTMTFGPIRKGGLRAGEPAPARD